MAACIALAVQIPVLANEVGAPAFVHQWLPGARLLGEGRLRVWGLRIFDARLWTGPRFDAQAFADEPLVLELSYRRRLRGAAIAQRSIEEIQRQRALAPGQAERWLQALAGLLPDVASGDRLTGLHRPGQGMQLWHGDRPLGAIDDAELAQRFFGIWLSPQTSEPALRRALLSLPAEGMQ